MHPTRHNIAGVLANHARRRPSHPAIVSAEGTVRYGELDLLVRQRAAFLMKLGVGPGDVVGVCLRDRAEHVLLLYAIAAVGAAILPLDWRWTVEEKIRIAKFFEADHVLHEADDPIADSVNGVAIEPSWQDRLADLDPLSELTEARDRPLVISLSSGTTGTPKGPAISQSHMLNRFMIYIVSLGFHERDRYLAVLPLYFGGGRGFAMCALYCGATVKLLAPPISADALAAEARAWRPSMMLLVPTLLRRLLALPASSGPLPASLRILITTGAMLHPDERQQVLRRLSPKLVNFYGCTEGGGLSLLLPEHRGAAAESVGQPVFGTDLEIVDQSNLLVTTGSVGRIRYRGPGVAIGFYKNPAASAEAFADGWFYPGDLGRLDEDGFLYLAGRAKDMIVRGGVNVYPEEIEQVLCGHASVSDAAVVAWPSPDLGEEIAAYAVVAGDVEEAVLLDHCRTHLAPYKVPRAVFFIEELPRSSVGKVRKNELVRALPDLPAKSE